MAAGIAGAHVSMLQRALADACMCACTHTRWQVREVLDTMRTAARLGTSSLAAYVISMSQAASDVLAVELLQKEARMMVRPAAAAAARRQRLLLRSEQQAAAASTACRSSHIMRTTYGAATELLTLLHPCCCCCARCRPMHARARQGCRRDGQVAQPRQQPARGASV